MLSLFPAKVALSLLPLPSNIVFSGVSGTIWDGDIDNLSIGERALDHIHWRINLWKLFTANLSIELDVGNRGSVVSGKTNINLSHSGISLTDLRFESPSEFLLGNTRLPFKTEVKGSLNLIVPAFVQGKPWCERLSGKVFLEDLNVKNQFGNYPLGNIDLELACLNGDIQLSANEADNKLGLKGKASLLANNKVDIEAGIKQTPTQPKELSQVLRFLGQPNAEGFYPLVYKGALPKL